MIGRQTTRIDQSPTTDKVAAPLIRSRLWRFINLFTYLLTYFKKLTNNDSLLNTGKEQKSKESFKKLNRILYVRFVCEQSYNYVRRNVYEDALHRLTHVAQESMTDRASLCRPILLSSSSRTVFPAWAHGWRT